MTLNFLGNFIIIPPENNLKHRTLAVVATLMGILIQIHIWPLILYMLHNKPQGNFSKLPASNCTNCGKTMNASLSAQQSRAPQSGDIAICSGCASINVYSDDLMLRAPTMKELYEMSHDNSVKEAQEFVRTMNSKENKDDISSD